MPKPLSDRLAKSDLLARIEHLLDAAAGLVGATDGVLAVTKHGKALDPGMRTVLEDQRDKLLEAVADVLGSRQLELFESEEESTEEPRTIRL